MASPDPLKANANIKAEFKLKLRQQAARPYIRPPQPSPVPCLQIGVSHLPADLLGNERAFPEKLAASAARNWHLVVLQKWENGATGHESLGKMKEILTAKGAWPPNRESVP